MELLKQLKLQLMHLLILLQIHLVELLMQLKTIDASFDLTQTSLVELLKQLKTQLICLLISLLVHLVELSSQLKNKLMHLPFSCKLIWWSC
jgi:hypothetical protein